LQLNNDLESFSLLITTIGSYYHTRRRPLQVFFHQEPKGQDRYFIRFLIDRKHVVEYSIEYEAKVRGNIGGLRLGIGPEYFPPIVFWSEMESRRFSMAATTEAICDNLALLDEFLEREHGARPGGWRKYFGSA
jgi:hypothetical protein